MSAIIKWNPFRELDAFQNRFTTMLGRSLVSGNGEESLGMTEWSPLVDITEDEKQYLIKAELPEVKKEDVKVTVQDGTLHISGEKRFEKEAKGKKYHRIERAYGSFDRIFVIPEGANAEAVKAEFHDGLLEVSLPKSDHPKSKTLEVKVS